MNTGRTKTHGAHIPLPLLASVGLGLGYLVVLGVFALAFERPSAAGWGGFAIVAAVVVITSIGIGQFLARTGD